MKSFRSSVLQPLFAGFLFLLPIYLTVLLVLKAMKALGNIVRPLAKLLPKAFPAEAVISLLVVLMLCFLVGVLLDTHFGQTMRGKVTNSVLQKIPGYEVVRSLTRQLAGQGGDSDWQPALAEIEEALVPAFIIEELDDGRFTIFVPSSPTPFTGSIYILTPERVYPLKVPFTQAIKAVTRWGCGSKALVEAMQHPRKPSYSLK